MPTSPVRLPPPTCVSAPSRHNPQVGINSTSGATSSTTCPTPYRRASTGPWAKRDRPCAALAERRLTALARSLECEHQGGGGAVHGQPDRESQQLHRDLHLQRQALAGRGNGPALGSAALLDAKKRLRRVRGHRDLRLLVTALDVRSLTGGLSKLRESPRIHGHGVRYLPKFNSGWDNPTKGRQHSGAAGR